MNRFIDSQPDDVATMLRTWLEPDHLAGPGVRATLLTGPQKAAIVLAQLDTDRASQGPAGR